MDLMRSGGTAALTVLYALSFVVVCLGTCFAADAAAEHACCAGEDGFRVAARDCCSVVPGRSETPQAMAAPAPVAVVALPWAVLATPLDQSLTPPLVKAASPPVVLRI
jgi:hypothetical protein